MAGACAGLKVLEIANGMPGALAAMVLGDHGADVVKLESPDGDPLTSEAGFRLWNRSKQRIALDLRDPRQRERARELGSKAYWQALGYSPEFVVLFLPGEPFLSAALQESPQLLEEALSDKVIIATPATLIALLLAVAYGWRERQAEENAQRISALGREMYERIATWAGHLDRVGDSLEKAVKAYNESVGSLEGRVLVSARRFKELGAGTEREMPEAAQVDVGVRRMAGNGNPDS